MWKFVGVREIGGAGSLGFVVGFFFSCKKNNNNNILRENQKIQGDRLV